MPISCSSKSFTNLSPRFPTEAAAASERKGPPSGGPKRGDGEEIGLGRLVRCQDDRGTLDHVVDQHALRVTQAERGLLLTVDDADFDGLIGEGADRGEQGGDQQGFEGLGRHGLGPSVLRLPL